MSTVSARTPPPPPPPSVSLSTPAVPRKTPPPARMRASPDHATAVPFPAPLTREAAPQDVLRQLLREWCGGMAELLISEAAAADVLGYKDTPHLRACEATEENWVGGAVAAFPVTHALMGDKRGPLLSSPRFYENDVLHHHHYHRGNVPVGIVSCESSTERLGAKLTQLLPALHPGATAASASAAAAVAAARSSPPLPLHSAHALHDVAMLLLDKSETAATLSNAKGLPSPSTSRLTVGPPIPSLMPDTTTSSPPTTTTTATAVAMDRTNAKTSWWFTLADALIAAMDAFDAVVDTVFRSDHSSAPANTELFTSSSPHCLTASLGVPSGAAAGWEVDDGAAAEEVAGSCIMAGLLLSRNVQVRHGLAYATVTSPLLVVLDLDLTVLRQPLSSIAFRTVQTMPARELRAVFVDVDFFRGVCEVLTRHGHKLAICSLTEGAADQHSCRRSVAEVVLSLLSAVLPATRNYLTSPDDIVCLPKSMAGPGKLFHLQVLQQRLNTKDKSASFLEAKETSSSANDKGNSTANLSFSSREAVDGIACEPAPSLQLPRWLSTDILLIDDDRENCRLAATQGYHVANCADTGLSAAWFAARPDVQVLLGVSADEIPRARWT